GDNQNHPRNRIDVNPPYGSTFPERVAHFRELLAELIARQILAERLAPDGDELPSRDVRQAPPGPRFRPQEPGSAGTGSEPTLHPA
ncbi:MAG: hypothetical protein ACKOEM_12895, partial [Planctomycetia bacterium]